MTSGPDGAPGILWAFSERDCWAWCGVRLATTGATGFPGLGRAEARAAALRAEDDWLRALHGAVGESWIELRYRTDPDRAGRSCVLLGRATAASADAAIGATMLLREQLTMSPAHLRTTPITDAAELAGWLAPFQGDDVDLVEVRKRWRVADSPMLGPGAHVASDALPAAGPDAASAWAPLWEALGRYPHSVVVAVGLTPHHLAVPDQRRLRATADFYRRLAEPAPPNGIYDMTRPADPESLKLAEHYADAAVRYRTGAFLLRIAMVSDARLPDLLAQHLVGAIWRGTAHQAVVVRPTPAERQLAELQFSSLAPSTWDEAYVRELPDRPLELQRRIAGLADHGGALAAFRLPPPGIPWPSGTAAGPREAQPTASDDRALRDLAAAVGVLSARLDHADGMARRQLAELTDTLRQWGQALLDELGQTRCPRVFTLVPVGERRWDRATRLELRLYCEQPGGWHALPDRQGVYTITEPAPWLRHIGPYLRVLIPLLKHAVPLAAPILGVAGVGLDSQLAADLSLIEHIVDQLPDAPSAAPGDTTPSATTEPMIHAALDSEFRAVEALLLELDPRRSWGGLSRVATADWQTRYLCPLHANAARAGTS